MSSSVEERDARQGGKSEGELDEVESAFRMTVEEGVERLERSVSALLATGFVGGLDVSIGVFALLVVLHATGENTVLGSLAFSIGFIALTLGKSELFTENFLVPIAALIAHRESPYAVVRLWIGTAVMNLVGGWVLVAIVMGGFPALRTPALKLGNHFADIGIGWRSFAMAMLGGLIITLMTWMIEGTRSSGAKMVAAIVAGFLLAVGEVNHCIVASLEMFAGLVAGAPYGYLDWAGMFAWAALGNMVGGIGLVTVLRFVQVGGRRLREEQEKRLAERRRQEAEG